MKERYIGKTRKGVKITATSELVEMWFTTAEERDKCFNKLEKNDLVVELKKKTR